LKFFLKNWSNLTIFLLILSTLPLFISYFG
jgi:hypothetical protein